MITYRTPVRNNTPQTITYTFKDQNNNVIDLTNMVSASLELKLQGQVFTTVTATFNTPRTAGGVQVAAYTPVGVGVWTAQFYVTDSGGNKYFGEPIQFTVVPNVEDLAVSQLPGY
jgi:hypothetical protein